MMYSNHTDPSSIEQKLHNVIVEEVRRVLDEFEDFGGITNDGFAEIAEDVADGVSKRLILRQTVELTTKLGGG